eukprot:scaffold293861_cov28-Tisochrysis_lutea.AAC.7
MHPTVCAGVASFPLVLSDPLRESPLEDDVRSERTRASDEGREWRMAASCLSPQRNRFRQGRLPPSSERQLAKFREEHHFSYRPSQPHHRLDKECLDGHGHHPRIISVQGQSRQRTTSCDGRP